MEYPVDLTEDIRFIKRPASSQGHPTIKPVELVERAIRNSSKTRDTILDVFSGSGTTLIACEKSRRQARVIERSRSIATWRFAGGRTSRGNAAIG